MFSIPDGVDLCLQLNAAYPDVKIVMTQWPEAMLTAFQPGSGSGNDDFDIIAVANFPTYQNFHQAAYAKAQAAGLSNVIYFEPSAEVGAFPRGCAGHPDVQGHQAIAAQLGPFLKGYMAW